jgi:hypothetical protein
VRTPAAASRHALRAFAAPPSVPRKKARESESRFFARASRRSAFALSRSSFFLTRVGK